MDNVSELYLKDKYLNKDIELLVNKQIIEYDLKSANTSLCKEYKLLSESDIERIEKLPKDCRNVTIGKLCRKDKTLNEGLKSAFKDIRRRFFIQNEIEDDDILSIKKDAIFCLRPCKYTDFGKCHFVEKNVYTSYMYLNKHLELYYNCGRIMDEHGIVHVKGISDISLETHKEHMLVFISGIFKLLETGDNKSLYKYFSKFVSDYKHRRLPTNYYREFDNMSVIRLMDLNVTFTKDTFIPYTPEETNEHLDIDYNFANVLLPMMKIILHK